MSRTDDLKPGKGVGGLVERWMLNFDSRQFLPSPNTFNRSSTAAIAPRHLRPLRPWFGDSLLTL